MDRRQFFTSVAAGGALALARGTVRADESCCRTFATPDEARQSPPEKLAYVIGVYAGTEVKAPDYLATIDLDPESKTYSQVIHRLSMPNIGDELHHFGWNACGSCHGERARRYLILPGLVSGRIHVVDTENPTEPKLHKVIEPTEVVRKTKLTAPHTVHCLADGRIMISMLGDENLQGPGGFLLLDDKFEIAGRSVCQPTLLRSGFFLLSTFSPLLSIFFGGQAKKIDQEFLESKRHRRCLTSRSGEIVWQKTKQPRE